MTDVWFPGATQDLGAGAGYTRGRNLMRTVKLHYTVGTNSQALIRDQGLAQFLLPKAGPPIQFAEVDALCYDSGTWNADGPGLEFERMSYDEPLTTDQITWGGELIRWLHVTWLFPLTLWDGPRVIATDCGFINHGSVLGRGTEHADHTDGVLRSEWDAMTGTPAPAPIPEEDDMAVLITSDPNAGSDTILYTGVSWRQVVPGEDQQLVDLGLLKEKSPRVVDAATMTRIRTSLPEVKAGAVAGPVTPSKPVPLKIALTGTATP